MKTDTVTIKAVGAAILGNSFFGLSFLFSKVALGRIEPFVLLAVRFLTAFAVLHLILLFGKAKIQLLGKPVWRILVLGIIQPVLYFTFENYGIRGTSSAFAGTMLATAPAVTLLAGFLILRECPSGIQTLGSILSVAGAAVISLTQQRGAASLAGILFLVCAVLASAGYNLMTKDTAESFTAFERTYVMIALGTVFFTMAAVLRVGGNFREMVLKPLADPSVWGSILYLACCSSVGAFFLLNYAFSYLSLAQASVFTNLVTVISIAAGVLFLKESFSAVQAVGSAVILAGVCLANQPGKWDNSGSKTV